MEIEPLNIFLAILRIGPTIAAIVIISIFFFMARTEIRSDDMERASIELSENFFASQLAASKYVLEPRQLALYDQSEAEIKTELPFLRTCSYGYFAEIEDLISGSEWSFGYNPPDSRGDSPVISPSVDGIHPYVIDKKSRTVFAANNERNTSRLSEFYGNVNQTKVTLTLYDTWLTRTSCAIERAFYLRENFTIANACDKSPVSFCSFSLKRHPDNNNLLCIFADRGIFTPADRRFDCRHFPENIIFEPVDITFSDTDRTTRSLLFVYPIKEGATADCASAKNGIGVAKKGDNVQTVLLCWEKANR